MKNICASAGQKPLPAMLVNTAKLIAAYYAAVPDPMIASQRVLFGTSGHRGSSLHRSFNEWHILAITQAICLYRKKHGINGPMFLGIDTHALSKPAQSSALEVLAANAVDVMLALEDEFTPTPVISHAILKFNHGRKTGLADGIVITPSHNPPHDGGFKYNSTNGGPASRSITDWISAQANAILESRLEGVKRLSLEKALNASCIHHHNYLNTYIDDLANIVDMDVIRRSTIKMGVDPLGGAGVHYWKHIAYQYGLNLEVINEIVDPSFSFMPLDWDGQIRMDPSSAYAMHDLIKIKDRYDLSFACDTDHDRHGIVTKTAGLLPSNHYLAVAIHYLFQHRPNWDPSNAVGKTIVSSQMIDRVAASLGKSIIEVPVGFKWFVDGLLDASLGFAGEESAGATFLRRDGRVWTTDKDGIVLCLLAGEITAKMERDPCLIYQDLARQLGESFYDRLETPATPQQKKILSELTIDQVKQTSLAGDKIKTILTQAPGNGASINGIKVETASGWFAVRPSGTEDIYKIYAESFQNKAHVRQIIKEAETIVNDVLTEQEAV